MPKGILGQSHKERFWMMVDKNGPIPELCPELGPCWIWIGALQRNGYGTFNLPDKQTTTHRIAYEWEYGILPKTMQPDHLCRNRPCVRPSHLEAVTCRENLLRGNTRAAANAKKTHCPLGHPYDEKNTRWTKSNTRICRMCANRKTNEWRIRTGYVSGWPAWRAKNKP